MGEIVDGEYQKYVGRIGAYIREHFFGATRACSHGQAPLRRTTRSSSAAATTPRRSTPPIARRETKGAPTVILAKTIKGYGLGEAGEGKNITHQQKKLNEDDLREFRTRFGIPISDDEVAEAPFYRPPDDSPEMKYMRERRKALGGSVPAARSWPPPEKSRRGRDSSTSSTRAARRPQGVDDDGVRAASSLLLSDKEIGKLIVPIVPDEARTFGMEASSAGRHLLHVGPALRAGRRDSSALLQGSEGRPDLEEGITEAGRCRRSSPRARPTRPTASTRFRSSSTTRCSASSASAT
jgi:pyruvate dehydrogenase E1 component